MGSSIGICIGIGMNAGSERPKSLNSSVSPSADFGNLRRTESCGSFPVKLNSGNNGNNGNSAEVSEGGFEGADVSIKELYKNGDVRRGVDVVRDENGVSVSREGRERGSSRSSDVYQNQNQNQGVGQSVGQSGCGCDGSKADSIGIGTGTGTGGSGTGSESGGGGVKNDVCAFRLSESMALVHAREILALSNRCVCVCVCMYVCEGEGV